MRSKLRDIPMSVSRNCNTECVCAAVDASRKGVRMERDKFTISVVPDSINRASNGPRIVPDQSAEWDAKWLHPHLNAARITEYPKAPAPLKAAPPLKAATPRKSTEPIEDVETEQQESDPLTIRFLRWLFPEVNQRRAKRFPTPGLVAYYWTGGAPYSYNVGDISATGLFLLTKERWAPGTLIQMTLQKQDGKIHHTDSSICVLSEVVRWGENGAGFNFILSDYENVLNYGFGPGEAIDRKSVEKFLQKIGVPETR